MAFLFLIRNYLEFHIKDFVAPEEDPGTAFHDKPETKEADDETYAQVNEIDSGSFDLYCQWPANSG